MPAADAIAAIQHAGGLAVMAHPVQMGLEADALGGVVGRLKELGLDGLETQHSDHLPADTARFEQLAAKLGLLTSGGSDFHGARKAIDIGAQQVPMAVYENLHVAHKARAR